MLPDTFCKFLHDAYKFLEEVRQADKAIGRQGYTKKQNELCEYSYSLQAERFTENFQRPIRLEHSFVFIPFLLFVPFLLVSV